MTKLLAVFMMGLGLLFSLVNGAQAFPGSATSTGNSCSACHSSTETGNPESDRPSEFTLAILGEGLLDLGDGNRNDGKDRGALPFFTVQPGGTIELNMEVLDGDSVYAVQLKRFEKAAVLGPADTDFLTGYTADLGWFGQGDLPNTYYTSVDGFVGTAWAGGPDPLTFTLTIPTDTPENVYDLEYAVAGRLGNADGRLRFYSDQHFYVNVVPEPGTVLLLGIAGLGFLGTGRRRR